MDIELYQVDLIMYVLRRAGPMARARLMKLLFLIDRELHRRYGAAAFRWRAYKYGPFSREVLDVLDAMEIYRSVEALAEVGDIVYVLATSAPADLPQEVKEAVDRVLDEWGRKSLGELAEYVNSLIVPGRPPLALDI